MTRPIYEPTLTRADAELGYGQRQLFRRPPPGEAVATLHIKVFPDEFFDVSFPITDGDFKFVFDIAEDMDGMVISNAEAYITSVSTAGDIVVFVSNLTQSQNLVTNLTIDEGEKNSGTSATPATLTGNDVAWMDECQIGVETGGAGTNAFGLGVILEFTG